MSDSEDNLSDLEQEQDPSISGSDEETSEKEESNGISNDNEDSDIKWSDLVSNVLSTTWFS